MNPWRECEGLLLALSLQHGGTWTLAAHRIDGGGVRYVASDGQGANIPVDNHPRRLVYRVARERNAGGEMITCDGCGSAIRGGRCSSCNDLSISHIREQETLEDYREPLPLTDAQRATDDTLVGWFEQWEQERMGGWFDEWEQERREAEDLRLFATGH